MSRNDLISKILNVAGLLAFVLLLPPIVSAIPNSISVQGKLTSSSGALQTGTLNFTFRIYDSFTSGNMLYETNITSASDSRGVFDVILANVNITFDSQLYMAVKVNNDSEMEPRINLTSVPYTFRANTSEALNPNASYAVTNLSVAGNITIGTGATTIEVSTQQFNATKDGNLFLANNITLGDQIKFRLGQLIDNMVNGWLKVTGSLNVTSSIVGASLNVSGTIQGGTLSDGNATITNGVVSAGQIQVGGGFSNGGLTLDSSGNIITQGDVLFSGNISLINVTFLSVNGSIIPGLDNVFDIGNASQRWRNANLSGFVAADTIEGANVRVRGSSVQIEADSFKISNYSSEYTSTGYKLSNFTGNYDSRADRFGYGNLTSIGARDINTSGSLNASGNVTFRQLANCNTIDTDANGLLTCGSDNSEDSAAFKLDNYSAEYASTGYKLANFTSNLNSVNASISLWNGTGNIYPREITGNVGIGTTSPLTPLEIHSATSQSVPFSINSTHSSQVAMRIRNQNSDAQWALAVDGASGFFEIMNGTSGLIGGAKLAITQSGSVGIGTTLPNYLLQVASGTDGRSVNLSNVLYVNGSSGNVGIGTDTPDGPLHVFNGSAGSVTPTTDGIDFVVESSDNAGISILTPDASQGQLVLGTPSDSFGAQVTWNHDADLMQVGTRNAGADLELTTDNGATVMHLNDAGRVGIGTTSPATVLDVKGKANFTGNFSVGQTGNYLFVDNTSGNVGIGTTGPQNKLEVIGAATFAGGVNASSLNVTGFSITDDSLVTLSDGSKKKIKDIEAGEEVLTLEETTGKLVPRKVNALLDHGVKPIYELTTEPYRAINTTGEHPYLVKLYSKDECNKYSGDVWNKEPDEFNSYCTRWVEVRHLSEGTEIAVPKLPEFNSYQSDYLSSSLGGRTSTLEACSESKSFNVLSPEKMGHLSFNANARYWTSFKCLASRDFASGKQSEKCDFGMNVTCLRINSSASLNSSSGSLDLENISSLCFSSSINKNSGATNSNLLKTRFIANTLKESPLPNNEESTTLTSTTINILNQSDLRYLCDKEVLILSENSSTSFSVSLDLDTILFNLAISSNSGLISLLNSKDHSMPDTFFINSKSSGISNVSSAIAAYNKNDYLKLSDSGITFVKIASIKQLEPQHVYDLSIEGTRNFIANDIVAHNTYLATSSGRVGVGTTNPQGSLGFNVANSSANITADVSNVANSNGTFDIGIGDTLAGGANIRGAMRFNHTNTAGTNIQFYTTEVGVANLERMRINYQGNVGIGTTSPGTTLHVSRSSRYQTLIDGANILINDTGGTSQFSIGTAGKAATADELWIVTNNTARITVKGDTGNIGIGTTGPNDILEIIGNVRISGSLNATSINASRFYARNGTAALPSYIFIEDTNTGIRLGNNDNISIVTGGSDRLTVDSSGSVGIGTTTPSFPLDISSANGQLRILSSTGTNQAFLRVQNTGGDVFVGGESSAGGSIFTGTTAYAGVFGTDSTNPVQLAVNSAVAMTILSGGNVGIGTAGPGSLLHIQSADPELRIQGDQLSGIRYAKFSMRNQPGTEIFSINGSYYGGASLININSPWNVAFNAGNVGINTTNPTAALDVRGVAKLNGSTQIGEGTKGIQFPVLSYINTTNNEKVDLFNITFSGGTVFQRGAIFSGIIELTFTHLDAANNGNGAMVMAFTAAQTEFSYANISKAAAGTSTMPNLDFATSGGVMQIQIVTPMNLTGKAALMGIGGASTNEVLTSITPNNFNGH